MSERLLDVRRVAERLGVSIRQVWKLNARGRTPAALRLGRSVRWRETDIDRFVRLGCPPREQFEAATGAETAR